MAHWLEISAAQPRFAPGEGEPPQGPHGIHIGGGGGVGPTHGDLGGNEAARAPDFACAQSAPVGRTEIDQPGSPVGIEEDVVR